MPSDPFKLENFLSDKKLKPAKDLSYDEAFLDVQQEEGPILDDEKDSFNLRLLAGILAIAFLLLGSRVYNLQIVRGKEYRDLAEGNKLRIQYLLAPRGLILDRFGEALASNIPSFELVVSAQDLSQDQTVVNKQAELVASILGQNPQELLDRLRKLDRSVFGASTIAQNLTKEQALTLIAKQEELKAFSVQNNPIREYKDPIPFAHLIGYTGKITSEELASRSYENYLLNDNIGKTGLELEYEAYLRGTPGRKQMEIDAAGTFKKNLPELPALPGQDLKLNIDAELQKVLYTSITEIMRRGAAHRAAAAAIEPQTGKVLAFISLPGFDNNWFARGITSAEYQSLINDQNIPLLNRVISGTYPPGSTVKPMLGLAALSEGVVNPSTKILDDGMIRIGEFTYYGYDRSGLGLMDIYSAIARSSDIYFYTIGGGNPKTTIVGLGPDKIAEWYRKFNLGKNLGIDLPGEKNGLVPDPAWKEATRGEQWYLGNTYHYSIGQGDLLVTPLQVLSWTATIATGKIMQPYIADEVVGVEKKLPKVLKENFLDANWLKVVQDGMRQAVTSGSARSLADLPIAVAGKTGTAQFDSRNLNRTHAWFTSYAPFENPQIALAVLVESGGEGSLVAAPIARKVYEWWAENRCSDGC